MFEKAMEDAAGLTACEPGQAMKMPEVLVVRELMGPEEEPRSCPHCGCGRIAGRASRGGDPEGGGEVEVTRRWLRRGCKRTSDRRTNGIFRRPGPGPGSGPGSPGPCAA